MMQKIAFFIQSEKRAFEMAHDNSFFPPGSLPIKIVPIGRQTSIAAHSHDFYELVIVFDGEGRHCTETETYRIRTGDVFLIKPGSAHRYDLTDGLSIVNLLYQPERLNLPLYDLADTPGYHAFFELEPALRQEHGFRSRLQVNGETLEYLRNLIARLAEELEGREKGCLFAAVAYLMQIISCISRSFSTPQMPAQLDLFRLSQTMSYIERNWNRELTLAELARLASMSSSTLYRMFMKTLGKSPMNYVIDVKVAKAATLLSSSTDSVSVIAAKAGFPDSNYFSRLFKHHMGITPRQYRERFH